MYVEEEEIEESGGSGSGTGLLCVPVALQPLVDSIRHIGLLGFLRLWSHYGVNF